MLKRNCRVSYKILGVKYTLTLFRSFGVPTMGNIKPLLKSLSKIFGHSDKNVRAEGTSLSIVLYTYLGPALLPALSDLKPVQMSELQKSFESMDAEGKGAGSGKPTRFTRKMQREREAVETAGGDENVGADEAGGEAEEAFDPMSLLDPVDVLALFPSDLESRLSSTKWKDRLEALEECNKILTDSKNAKILDSNADAYGPLAQTLGTKCKSDANVNVVMEACKVIEGLARGLGKSFGRHRAMVMPGMMERLKERKASVGEALGKALDAIFSTVSLSDIRKIWWRLNCIITDNLAGHYRRCPHLAKIKKPTSQGGHSQIPPSLSSNYP